MMRGVSHLGGRGARARASAAENGSPNGARAPSPGRGGRDRAEAAASTGAAPVPQRATAPSRRPTDEPLGADRGPHASPSSSAIEAAPALPAADRARRRRARRVAQDRHEGARHLRQRAARGARRGDLGQDLGLHDLPVARVRGRPLLRAAGDGRELLEGRARQLGLVRGGREADPDRDLPRLPVGDLAASRTCGACSSTTAPSTR